MNITKKLNDTLQTSQSKSLFTALVTLVFVIIIFILGVQPAYNSIIFQIDENSKRDILLNKLGNKLVVSKKLTDEYSKNTGIINYFNYVYPNNIDQSNIISILLTTAKTDSLVLSSVSFGDTTNVTTKGQEEISISITGTQSNIIRFMKDLESSSRIFNIRNVNITQALDKNTNKVTSNNYIAGLSITYYYYIRPLAVK